MVVGCVLQRYGALCNTVDLPALLQRGSQLTIDLFAFLMFLGVAEGSADRLPDLTPLVALIASLALSLAVVIAVRPPS